MQQGFSMGRWVCARAGVHLGKPKQASARETDLADGLILGFGIKAFTRL